MHCKLYIALLLHYSLYDIVDKNIFCNIMHAYYILCCDIINSCCIINSYYIINKYCVVNRYHIINE